jgi:hypothetical protein
MPGDSVVDLQDRVPTQNVVSVEKRQRRVRPGGGMNGIPPPLRAQYRRALVLAVATATGSTGLVTCGIASALLGDRFQRTRTRGFGGLDKSHSRRLNSSVAMTLPLSEDQGPDCSGVALNVSTEGRGCDGLRDAGGEGGLRPSGASTALLL